MQECKPYHFTMVEAVEPFKLHITSMSYLYEVFEHLQLLCIDIWMHIHSVTTTDVSPDLGELAKSLGDARVQTIPLCYSWGCQTFQTASHIYVIHIWGVWAPSTVGDGHMDAHSLRYQHRRIPKFGIFSRKSRWCKSANHTTLLSFRCGTLFNASSIKSSDFLIFSFLCFNTNSTVGFIVLSSTSMRS
jgi:hypothetical protein